MPTVTEFIALLKAYRGKAYTRYTIAMLICGGGILGTSIGTIIVQRASDAVSPSNNEAPWWIAASVGTALVVASPILFFYMYGRDPDNHRSAPPARDGAVSFSIPAGIRFEDAANLLGEECETNILLQGFTDIEREAPLKPQTLTCDNIEDAIKELGALAANREIGDYSVTRTGQRLIVHRGSK